MVGVLGSIGKIENEKVLLVSSLDYLSSGIIALESNKYGAPENYGTRSICMH